MADSNGIGHAGYIDQISENEIIGWLLVEPGMRRRKIIRARVDGTAFYTVHANVHRPDVQNAGHGDSEVGFHFRIPPDLKDGGEHDIVFLDLDGRPLMICNVAAGTTAESWRYSSGEAPRGQAPPAARLVVHLEQMRETGLEGWAYSEADPASPVGLYVVIDGHPEAMVRCDIARDDVGASGHPSTRVGFSIPVPRRCFDGGSHSVQFLAGDGQELLLLSNIPAIEGSLSFRFPAERLIGRVDGLHDGAIRGWALVHDRCRDTRQGGLCIVVFLQGQPIARLTANGFRADVAESHDSSPTCGFVFVPPQNLLAGKIAELRFRVMPGGYELENSPYKAAFPDLDADRQLRALAAAADSLFTQMWALRSHINALLPADPDTLLTYDSWARAYYSRLSAMPPRLLANEDAKSLPLVSIVCPVYRPRISDFAAAVASVIAQTYQNWELLIVDDASRSPELTACIDAFVARDKRIRAKPARRNGGISMASNAALALARGQYVALFDHDDVMVDRALELMVDAALTTGAKVLYSDEDKIDDAGLYSEPNFKPDWNYRLLLAQNYVCHLLMVERTHLLQAGPFRTACDGAQDHDLILRLAEITPPADIFHVPEVLYHWRKTPSSTAGSATSKSYTVTAGIRAVSDHLARPGVVPEGVTAEVSSPRGITIYNVTWRLSVEPRVTIIIPYREQIDMTRECVDALRSVTAYGNFEILLMDNWSTSDDALDFAAEQGGMARTRVVRVEEPFNYSRINNIAVAASDSEFLLFLNNDVVVLERDWLTQMVGEVLADPKIGLVGAKLLYPNGLVQHGGIILGVGGVADHAHRGLSAIDPGYAARAISAQDLSAVTAACMLCRREAFAAAGGFDQRDLRVAFNDVDLCLKIGAAGYRIVWTPAVRAEHRESFSRGNDFTPEHQPRFFHENQVMQDRWAHVLPTDRAYSRHFSRRGGLFLDLTARPDQSAIVEGGIAGSVNHAIKQRASALTQTDSAV